MSVAQGSIDDRQEQWFDSAWWDGQIGMAIATPDPVLANLRITVAHYHLSLALREVLGPDTGANFHTWATWGSKKAGATIRQEDVPHIRALALLAGGGLGLLGTAEVRHRLGDTRLLASTTGTLLGGWGADALARQLLDHAGRMILGGNITVIDDIGRQTARFVSNFHGHPEPDAGRLEEFRGGLRPGPTAAGGQDLLKHAFTHYYQARHARDLDDKHQQMLLANLYTILHEHIRLQPYIAGAMPLLARRLITRRLLNFYAGLRKMSVGRDVVPLDGVDCPCTLRHVENAELLSFLNGPSGWDRTPDSLLGSHADNWADIRDRMNFICDLFRSYHVDPGLFGAPYTPAQCAQIEAGRIPGGAL
ncbi:MAG TPA: hypothetical protein VFE42_28495 [Chloroflexota bacterium]|nr:hypothetical protein [Chloroflexota bacterium]